MQQDPEQDQSQWYSGHKLPDSLMPTGSSHFCPHCGHALATRFVAGEPRNSWHCEQCGEDHHEHPMIVVTCFVSHRDRLLWVRRAIEPKRGKWAIPGGYLEQGEPLRAGAARELREEAGVNVDPDRLELYMMGTLTFINQIYVGFRIEVDSEACVAGPESLACTFFSRAQCPWQDLAYPEVNDSIEQAYADLENGTFTQWHIEMTPERYDRRAIVTKAGQP